MSVLDQIEFEHPVEQSTLEPDLYSWKSGTYFILGIICLVAMYLVDIKLPFRTFLDMHAYVMNALKD